MKKILVTYNMFREAFSELEEKYEVTFPTEKRFTHEEILERIGEYDALCSLFNMPINKELLDRGKNLKIVANYAVGYDNIDVAYAHEKGIAVANTPGPVTAPTANLALSLLLDAARRVTEFDRNLRLKGQGYKLALGDSLGTSIDGKTLGIFGMGRIGKALAKRAIACNMKVIYHNRRRLETTEESVLGVRYVSLEELFKQSDFLSLNAPMTTETHHIINADSLRMMKPSAILINAARGGLVDEKALIEALKEGVIRAAGLDVFENDDRPLPELLTMDNVVITPHIGTQTLETRIEMAKNVCDNVIGFFENDRPISIVSKG